MSYEEGFGTALAYNKDEDKYFVGDEARDLALNKLSNAVNFKQILWSISNDKLTSENEKDTKNQHNFYCLGYI